MTARPRKTISAPVIPATEVAEVPSHLVHITDSLSVWATDATQDQTAVVMKAARLAERNPGRSVEAVGLFFQVVEKLLLDPDEDVPAIDEAIINGEVTVEQLAKMFFTEDGADAEPAPAKRVRRR